MPLPSRLSPIIRYYCFTPIIFFTEITIDITICHIAEMRCDVYAFFMRRASRVMLRREVQKSERYAATCEEYFDY